MSGCRASLRCDERTKDVVEERRSVDGVALYDNLA